VKLKFIDKKVTVQRRYVDLNGSLFNFNEVIEVLEGLNGTDGYFTFIVIQNSKLQAELARRGAIKVNAKGAAYMGSNFDKFFKAVLKGYD
jgi:hypothetical protein